MQILILTSEYPNSKSSYDTPVVHFYAKEWVKMGYSVNVIHYRSVFPSFFYTIARCFKPLIKRFFKTDFIPFEKLHKEMKYQLDGVNIITEPIFKPIPHVKYSFSVIKKKVEKIIYENEQSGTSPDVIIGHFLNPQLQIFTLLRKVYPKIKFSLVLHESPREIDRLFGSSAKNYLSNVDYIGFRYCEMQNLFKEIYGSEFATFLCPSGVPDDYILDDIPNGKFTSEFLSFAFVGMLIPLKNVDIILEALFSAFPKKDFSFKLIGDGMLYSEIESQIIEYGLQDQVKMLGKKTRDEVQQELRNTDVFVMVSKPEAFGLVYLEAMGKGCITVGTVGQGIDGIIQHGNNGFLCEARNTDSLKNILFKISAMSYEEKMYMSQKALATARNMTDGKIAYSYLQKLKLV